MLSAVIFFSPTISNAQLNSVLSADINGVINNQVATSATNIDIDNDDSLEITTSGVVIVSSTQVDSESDLEAFSANAEAQAIINTK